MNGKCSSCNTFLTALTKQDYCCLNEQCSNFTVVVHTKLNENKPFSETIEIIEDLKNEYILLESIRQCVKEIVVLLDFYNNFGYFENMTLFSNKLHELKHLVDTD